MARRRVVFVIVEGPTDEVSLGVALSNVYDEDSVYIHIMHGDITTKKGVNSTNVVAKVGNEIKQYAVSNHYKKTDFKQIIHIVDMDGAYISDDLVVDEEGLESIVYETEKIRTSNVEGIIKRNRQKRENIDRLRMHGVIWEIPYKIYYMSCNLDHVLHNKMNSSDEEKEADAYAFARKYKNDKNGFLDYICKSDFSVEGSYKDSWLWIERDANSLKRYTNLGLGLDRDNGEEKEEK